MAPADLSIGRAASARNATKIREAKRLLNHDLALIPLVGAHPVFENWRLKRPLEGLDELIACADCGYNFGVRTGDVDEREGPRRREKTPP